MPRQFTLMCVLLFAGATAASWWLTVRPGASPRELATPVAFLVVVLAVLLCLLGVTGTSPSGLAGGIKHVLAGG